MPRAYGLSLLAACCLLTGCARLGPKQYLELAPETPPGGKPDPTLAYLASDVLTARLRNVPGTEVTVNAGRVRVRYPITADRDWLLRMCTQLGQLNFVLIPDGLEPAEGNSADWKDASAGKLVPSAEVLRRGKVVFSGADLNGQASAVPGDRPGEWEVHFEFAPHRRPAFETLTRSHVGSYVAIVLDGDILTAAPIKSRIIAEGALSAGFTRREAEDLARIMNSGPLPVALRVVEKPGPRAKT